jgi:large subunit ribosomal protein L25
MKTIELGAERRDLLTKGGLRQMRLQGRIPAVVYGGSADAASLIIDGKQLSQVLKGHGTNVLMDLKVAGTSEVVLLKDVQRHFVSHNILHVDFQRVSMTEKLEVNVPLHITGEAPGVKLSGGILEHILRELRVSCLPGDIPDGITVDVSALQLNQGLKVKDIPLPSGVETVTDSNSLVVNIVAPAEEEAATPAAAGAPTSAEPEVIAKGKKPEEGEEGAAAAGAKPGAASAGKDAKAAPAAGGKEKK